MIVAFIVVTLACWQDPGYAHQGVRVTIEPSFGSFAGILAVLAAVGVFARRRSGHHQRPAPAR